MNAQAGLAAASGVSFEQTVARSLAHRTNLGEVLVTDSVQTGDDEFVVGFQVPRAHLLWADRAAARHDVFAAAEAARQASFVVIHRYLGVPVGLPFTMHAFSLRVDEPEAFRDDRRSALEGLLQYRVTRKAFRGSSQGDMSFEGIALIGGEPVMTFSGDVVFLPKDDYQALRSYQRRRRPVTAAPAAPVVPLPAGAVGRRDQRNVVVGEPHIVAGESDAGTGLRFPLLVDRDHPSFFDHDYDHLPGPMCVEAFRQAAIVTAVRAGRLSGPEAVVTAVSADFGDFAEIDTPAECSVELLPAAGAQEIEVAVGLNQYDKTIATGALTLLPH